MKRRKLDTTRHHEWEADTQRHLLVCIQAIQASLNPTDRLIAKYVLADPERVISSSIVDMREGSGASVGSIVGFCRRLGLKGFVNLRIALAREFAQGGLSAGEAQQDESVFEEVFHFHAQSLMDTLQINQPETLERAAHAIEKARRIELFSIGISYAVAYTARCKFHLIGLPAAAEFDSHMQLIAATHLRKGDVAFGISRSGTTRETVHCLEVAQGRDVTTICLTNAMMSPITACAHIALYATPSEVKYFQAPLASRSTQLAVIDALFVFLAQKDKDRTAARLQHFGEELLMHRLS